MNNQQTKTKFAHLVTRIATVKLSKEFFYLTFLSSMMIFTPYLHLMYYGSKDIKGDFFGFPWMSSFLFALALPLFMISTGLLIRYFALKYKEPFLKFLSYAVLLSGCFYLSWTFWTTPSDFKDMSLTTYLTVLVLLTIGFLLVVILIDKFLKKGEERLRTALESLVKFCLKWGWKIQAEQRMEYKEDFFNTSREAGISK